MVRLVVVALQWLTRHFVMLLLIMAVLLIGRWALTGMRQLEQARSEAVALQRNRAALQAEPARVAGWIDALLASGSGTAADAGDALRRRLAAERAQREAERAALAAGNPIALRLPGSEAFLAATRLDIEIGALRRAEGYLQTQSALAQALGNAKAARRTLVAERAQSQAAIDARLARRRALSAEHTILREIPGTAVYREIDRLDAERHALEAQRARHDASLKLLDDSARLGHEWQRDFRTAGQRALRFVPGLSARRAGPAERPLPRRRQHRLRGDAGRGRVAQPRLRQGLDRSDRFDAQGLRHLKRSLGPHPGPAGPRRLAEIIDPMHLLIPFASASSEAAEAATHVLRDLALPQLARLTARLAAAQRDSGEADSLSPPHERAIAAAWGWRADDGRLPFAAHAAQRDGIAVGAQAWGLLTPAHWLLGRDHVLLADPDALDLAEAESRALFDAVRALFESEGFTLAWGAPQRWYAAHESLAELPCASLDRVIGRRIETWLAGGRGHAPARLVRRLQSEVQMTLYPHPVNEAREARGVPSVNSFWLSGCGRHQPADEAAVQVDLSLRAPLLAQDWAAWADAWRALDAGPIAALLQHAQAGEPVALTLCGERHAQRFESARRSFFERTLQRWSAPPPHALLEVL